MDNFFALLNLGFAALISTYALAYARDATNGTHGWPQRLIAAGLCLLNVVIAGIDGGTALLYFTL